MARVRWFVGAAVVAWGCAAVQAKYPAWEPTSPLVPAASNRDVALRDLQQSRELWLERNWGSYSYLRAVQRSSEELEFTMVVVDRGKVVERSLLATRVSELGDRMSGKPGEVPRLLWRERSGELGQHAGAGPALTLEAVYDSCRDQVLLRRGPAVPRLSFHRDGLLQHCAFLDEDCPECPVISLQGVSSATPSPWQTPPDLVCTDRFGLFLHDQGPSDGFPCEICNCVANNVADPRPKPKPTLAQLGECAETGWDCPELETDICKIDPAACPPGPLLPERANWFCYSLLTADGCSGAFRPLTPECTALPHPLSWSDPNWKRRCRPEFR